MVELRNQPHDLSVFRDRVGVEVLLFEEIPEFAQRQAASYRLDIAGHVVCDDLFDKAFQGVTLNREIRLIQPVFRRSALIEINLSVKARSIGWLS
jgi:hypothetical protein